MGSLLHYVPEVRNARAIQLLAGGFSEDTVSVVTMENGLKLLLKSGPLEGLSRKKEVAAHMMKLKRHGVHCADVLTVDSCPDHNLAYTLTTFIEGTTIRENMHSLSTKEQWNAGKDSGEDLILIHSYDVSVDHPSWKERAVAKHRRYEVDFHRLGLHFTKTQEVFAFIESHLHLMNDRPNQFQHDDFHVGNLIVNDSTYAGVIDFDRFDWGDPWHDFTKLAFFSQECSSAFAVGQLYGYFSGNEPPANFWPFYSLYTAMGIISAMVWTNKMNPENAAAMRQRIDRICIEHDDFRLYKPKWFTHYEQE
ncbi:aminoglycoside phosphotransferase family protein [Aureibacillus halotolerans]|uniref:Aminoglycoside phosphotransferase (APT) family kinase protein n=1 Tax=Aureibacillus halotolerans TaxID=1508390 RepID=A0A4R6UCD2_9BACI|nr:aminoglycoside phosphotransferase family protein [Aureibacillus halotolerans]TDQ42669.1 aminoglycoside phosphotransferase (APT) family kinase protein [Aureibacillus halotolerans]